MPRRLTDIEKAMAMEQRKAAAWERAHEKDLERTMDDKSRSRARIMLDGRRVDRLIRLGMYGEGEDDEITYSESDKFVPVVGHEHRVSVKEADLAARVKHVLSFLTMGQREDLRSYYIEGLTWQEMRRGKESRQAVHQRIMWARNAFEKSWLEHAMDDIELREEDF